MMDRRPVVGYKLKIGEDAHVFIGFGGPHTFEGFEGRDLVVKAAKSPGGLPVVVMDCDRLSNVTSYGIVTMQFRPKNMGGRTVVADISPVLEGEPQPGPPRRPDPIEIDEEEEEQIEPIEIPESDAEELPPPLSPSRALLAPEKKIRKKKKKKKRKSNVPEPWPEEPHEATDEQKRCIICTERAQATYFNGCSPIFHAALCVRCAIERFSEFKNKCPICRAKFTRIKRVKEIVYC